MNNTNRLIDDFKKQSKNTIWKHLNAMAANYAVYSTRLKGMPPFLCDHEIYLYCNDTNLVIVCLNSCGHGEEHTYEESATLAELIMEEGREPRESMVWKLAMTASAISKYLKERNMPIEVCGVLLTEADIINGYRLEPMWDRHKVMVIDCLRQLKNKKIGINEDSELPCKRYANTIIEYSNEISKAYAEATEHDHDPEDDNPNREELDKILDELAALEIKNVVKEYVTGEPEDDPTEEDDSQEEPDSPSESNAGCSLESFVDSFVPDGNIEQNHDTNINVEILRPIVNPREELNKLVGCADIKKHMDELLDLSIFNNMMRRQFPQNKHHEVSLHSIFFGRPGTGKTTVCKIFGSLLRQAGVLSIGHVVICDRSTFIGTLWGDEERAMNQVIEKAKGGVLMIDEAYLFNSNNDRDPGKIVIQLLMNLLADETQRDIAVVLCGYKEPMMKLLDSNPGLQSRFPNKFEFADFTVDELLQITKLRIKGYGYRFTTQAWEKYRSIITQAYLQRDPDTWGNARFIANQLERIYLQHAVRCVKLKPKDKRELLKLTPDDVVPIEVPRQKKRIGF